MLKSPFQQDTPQERAKYQAIRSQPADSFNQESGLLNDDEQANQYRQRRIERIRSLAYTPPEPARPCGEPHPETTPLRQSARDLVHSWGDLTAWLASQQDKQEAAATLQIILGQSDIRYTAPEHQAWYRQQTRGRHGS